MWWHGNMNVKHTNVSRELGKMGCFLCTVSSRGGKLRFGGNAIWQLKLFWTCVRELTVAYIIHAVYISKLKHILQLPRFKMFDFFLFTYSNFNNNALNSFATRRDKTLSLGGTPHQFWKCFFFLLFCGVSGWFGFSGWGIGIFGFCSIQNVCIESIYSFSCSIII